MQSTNENDSVLANRLMFYVNMMLELNLRFTLVDRLIYLSSVIDFSIFVIIFVDDRSRPAPLLTGSSVFPEARSGRRQDPDQVLRIRRNT